MYLRFVSVFSPSLWHCIYFREMNSTWILKSFSSTSWNNHKCPSNSILLSSKSCRRNELLRVKCGVFIDCSIVDGRQTVIPTIKRYASSESNVQALHWWSSTFRHNVRAGVGLQAAASTSTTPYLKNKQHSKTISAVVTYGHFFILFSALICRGTASGCNISFR